METKASKPRRRSSWTMRGPFRGDMEQLDINDVVRKIAVMFQPGPLVEEIVARRSAVRAARVLRAGSRGQRPTTNGGAEPSRRRSSRDLTPDLRTRGDAESSGCARSSSTLALSTRRRRMTEEPRDPTTPSMFCGRQLTISSGPAHGGRLGGWDPAYRSASSATRPGHNARRR